MIELHYIYRVFDGMKRQYTQNRGLSGKEYTQDISDTDGNAIISLKNTADFICANTFIIISVNLEDINFNLLINICSWSRLRIKMLVISTPIYMKNFAKSLYVMLVTEFMNSI